jgi:hypothetical protein
MIYKGGRLLVRDIKLLLNSSYNNTLNDIGDWIIDKDLSNQYVQVYHNNINNQAVVVHRGTADLKDVGTDVKLMFGFKKNNRFEDARKIQKLAENKYGAQNVSTLGHSLGASVAEEVGQNSKEIITMNKPIIPSDILSKKKIGIKQYDIRTKKDPFSLLKPFQKDVKDITIESKTNNPLVEHSINTLDRLPEEMMIGEGRINKMKIKELKEFLKQVKKNNQTGKNILITGLNKTQLKELALKHAK